MKTFSLALTLLLLAVLSPLSAISQGTAFNYQGQLDVSNSPANGSYQMQFTLYPGSTGGTSSFGPVTNTAVAVTNGIFTTTIDFGSGAFIGNASWLDIAVRTNLPAAFTELTPRQQILPVPYAIFAAGASNAVNAVNANNANNANNAQNAVNAQTAQTANSVAAGAITGSAIAAGSLTAADFASGQLVTNLNGLTGGITLAVTNNLALTTNGNILTINGGYDYGLYYLTLPSGYQGVASAQPIPFNNGFGNGWAYVSASDAFAVPASGYYLIQMDGWTDTANAGFGAEYSPNGTTYTAILGSTAYSAGGTSFSHSFITYLTANNYLRFYNQTTTTIYFEAPTYPGTAFSVSITRIN